MYSFLICLLALVAGYFIYGGLVEKVFGPDPNRLTPALSRTDNVDYVPLPKWKVFMIQFLNIAGTGPVFGAIMGAKFGPAAYMWIVLGAIFAGAVHDYLMGMLSLKHDGAAFPDIVGKYLGGTVKKVLLVFSILVLLLVGAVFVYSPAIILGDIAGNGSRPAIMIWVAVIFVYYLIATMLPIDKVIAKIYPVFAVALLFMAVALMVCLFIKWPTIPEIWDGLGNLGEEKGLISGQPIFPCLFITIACGAISGFHATQSPLMARCMTNEKLGRPIFYGAMIVEGMVALVWAAVASYFFYDGGAAAVGSDLKASAPSVVTAISENWLGVFGGILATLGVVAAPITSGDTAFRSARLIIADFIHIEQKSIRSRLYISIPIFVVASLLLWYNIAFPDGFEIVWRYFGWANQTLAVFSLWTMTAFLSRFRKGYSYMIALLPAAFMTSVCLTYISVTKIGLNLPLGWSTAIGMSVFFLSILVFFILKRRTRQA